MKKDYGFVRVAAAVPKVNLADPERNAENICGLIDKAEEEQVSLLAFPELCVTGYSCADLFGQNLLIESAEKAVAEIARHTEGLAVTAVIGVPLRFSGHLYNCAAIIRNGKIHGLVPKIHLPNYGEFYEARWFSSGSEFMQSPAELNYAGQRTTLGTNQIFTLGRASFAVEICEDLWTPVPPSSFHSVAGALLTVNLSASNEVIGKDAYRRSLVAMQSARTTGGYIYCSAGYGESTQDLVYSGAALIAENGHILAENRRFSLSDSLIVADMDCGRLESLRQKSSTFRALSPDGKEDWRAVYRSVPLGEAAETDFAASLLHWIDPHPFVPSGSPEALDERCREVTDIQVEGLLTRLAHIGCRSAVIGISGGLDSTLALLVTVQAFDRLGWERSRIIGVTMPGYGTTDRTLGNALDLMAALGVTAREIPIAAACDRHFLDIGHDKDVHDVTYENSQARERTQILMDIANQTGGIVVGTGDLSELALGWATYNGDHMSMYAVNASIPKTLVRHLVRRTADRIEGAAGADGKVAGSAAGPEADTAAARPRTVRDILIDITETPVSPELLPAGKDGKILQVTEDLVGPYELHDFFLYNFFRFGFTPEKLRFLAEKAFAGRYDSKVISKWLRNFIRRFFSQQFKRSCLPDGPKVGSVTLSPRGDWRMPSDAVSRLFLESL